MKTKFIEATDGFNHGKFMLGRFEPEEWDRRSVILTEAGHMMGASLLGGRGWGPEHIFVMDLQTGEGAMFFPGGLAEYDLSKHQVWVCPMFEPFLKWLYKQKLTDDFHDLPAMVEIEGPKALYGYRRPGPGHSTT